jgi:hypothetical protein
MGNQGLTDILRILGIHRTIRPPTGAAVIIRKKPMDLAPVLIGHCDELYHRGDVEILGDARRRHLAVFGATGAGKSTLLRNMIASDIAAGHGATVVDPHGQLVDEILENHIPRWRTNDVIYFNPKDPDRSLGLNLLYCPRPEQRGLVVSNIVSTFKTLWADSWGNRLEYILRNGLHALLAQPRPVSILALPELLTNEGYRAEALANVDDPVVLKFFHGEFARWTPSFREEAIAPVLNRVGTFTTDPLVRAVIGQARSGFSFREAMDSEKIILCDLSEGTIGDDNARLLGSMIIMQERLAALSRADLAEEERVPHFLYVEEAHTFIGNFQRILSGTRKFRLFLTVATQGIDQLGKEAVDGIFTNAGNLVGFRSSNTDAEHLRDEFAVRFAGAALQDLPDFTAYARILRCKEGVCEPDDVVKIATYAPRRTPGAEWRSAIVRASNERYTRPRTEVDAEIARFLNHTQKPKKK